MDPIIRAAAVSPTARQLRRQPGQTAPAAVPARPAPAVAVAPAVVTEAAPGISPAQHQAALQERDTQIATLRAQAAQAGQALSDAYAEAERRGFAAGEAQGERAGIELLQAQADRLKALVFQIGQTRSEAIAEAQDALVEIAFAAVCRILGEQGASSASVRAAVSAAAQAAHEREALVIRLHPDDLALLRADIGAGQDAIRLAPDASIELGGCMIDSSNGTLDARFETQLANLATVLRTVRAARSIGQESL